MTKSRDNYQVSGRTAAELVTSLNFKLQRLGDRMDRIEGIRGTASIESNLDMNNNVIQEVGSGTVTDDAARLSDIAAVNAYLVTAGDGLVGGGAISTSPTLNVGAGTGISVAADSVAVATDGVDNTLLANMAQSTIKGRAAGAGTGDPADLTAAQVKAILAIASTDVSDFTEAAQDSVLNAATDSSTVDFTYNDGANTWTADVIDDSISNSKLRNSGACSVIARSANSTGDPADVSASSNDTLLRRTSDALSFGQLTAGMFPNAVVPDAALSSNVPLLNAQSNTQAGDYTFVAADAGKVMVHNGGAGHTFTIPAEASVNYSIGTRIYIMNEGSSLSVAITSDLLVRSGTGATGTRTLAADSLAMIVKSRSARWYITGDGIT